MPKVFISYKRDVEPDVRLAFSIFNRLKQAGNEVFIDTQIPVGEQWPKIIEQNVKTSDYLIVFLSAASAASEMVMEEISIARRLRQQQGRPKILPVRVAHQDPLPYDLGAWLDRLQQAMWRTDADDSAILGQLEAAVGGQNLPSATRNPDDLPLETSRSIPLPTFDPRWLDALDSGAGAVRLASPFYIERDLDRKAKQAITRGGETILIRGSRQSGKSSALARICQHAKHNGQQILFVDFQGVDKSRLKDLDKLLRYLAELMYLKLKTSEKPDRYWETALGPTDKLTDFLETEVLRHASAPFVLALDEVDRVFAYPGYFSEFFGLIRSWHNKRAFDEVWNNLNIVLVYSGESNLLIPDQNQSPFNVGEPLDSHDFTRDQVLELNRRHGSPLNPPADIDALMNMVSGHPYLVRKALFELVKTKGSLADLCSSAANDDGPFADHLQRCLVWLGTHSALRAAFKSSLNTGVCDTDGNFYELRSAGLISGHSRHSVEARCGLYRSYFTARL